MFMLSKIREEAEKHHITETQAYYRQKSAEKVGRSPAKSGWIDPYFRD